MTEKEAIQRLHDTAMKAQDWLSQNIGHREYPRLLRERDDAEAAFNTALTAIAAENERLGKLTENHREWGKLMHGLMDERDTLQSRLSASEAENERLRTRNGDTSAAEAKVYHKPHLTPWQWIRSLFAWKTIRDSGVWIYSQNTITGQRKASRYSRVYQPLMYDFLRPGDKVIDERGTRIVQGD